MYNKYVYIYIYIYLNPWEPTTFMFRGYNPYIGCLKPSIFMVLGSNGIYSKNIYPDLPVPCIFGTKLAVANRSGNDPTMVIPNKHLYFLKVNLPKQGLFPCKTRVNWFRGVYAIHMCVYYNIQEYIYILYIYIYMSIHLYLLEKYSKNGGESVSQLV